MASIRDATPVDFPIIVQMLRRYREAAPMFFLLEANNEQHIVNHLTEFVAGRGVVLVAEKNTQVIGMLIASIDRSFWHPEKCLMIEIAYWVEPEFRGGTFAYRLLKEYVRRGEALKQEGRIVNFLISKMSNSPDLSFDKFGFQKLEEFWVN
jgi:N-acetylglutamate synthase-like GNAT family acetyltransferase